jgi:hypothetical protein
MKTKYHIITQNETQNKTQINNNQIKINKNQVLLQLLYKNKNKFANMKEY